MVIYEIKFHQGSIFFNKTYTLLFSQKFKSHFNHIIRQIWFNNILNFEKYSHFFPQNSSGTDDFFKYTFTNMAVNSTQGVVKKVDVTIWVKSSGETHSLFLSTAEVDTLKKKHLLYYITSWHFDPSPWVIIRAKIKNYISISWFIPCFLLSDPWFPCSVTFN